MYCEGILGSWNPGTSGNAGSGNGRLAVRNFSSCEETHVYQWFDVLRAFMFYRFLASFLPVQDEKMLALRFFGDPNWDPFA